MERSGPEGPAREMIDTNDPNDTPSWQFRAACRGEDSSLFFAPGYFAREAKAKAICRICPVRMDCLEYAIGIRESYGVWGGLNESERRALIRDRERRQVS